MKITIKSLTPIHIGSGEEISPIEYLIEGDYFHRLHMDGLFADSDFQPLLEKFIESALTERYIGELLPHDLLRKHILYSIPITGVAKDYLKTNRTLVKAFIKTSGKVFIPGSSLKGSLLSAVFYYSLKESYISNTYWEVKERGEGITLTAKEFITKSLQGRFRYENLLDFAFSRFTKGGVKTRFAHWFDVIDSDAHKPSEVLQVSLAKVKGSKSGSELPILYETLKEGVEFSAEIKSQNTVFNEEKILSLTDDFYKKVLNKDKAQIKSDGIIIRLGQGSTAYATSCLILAEELGIRNYRVKPPATRKRIDEILPMGWVQLKKE
uniref:CRISPR system Cms protein Csm5 n=1 Tax=candidate division WOR-3 bacterium TaxID=2052148 RepID=A0A7C6A843_UNCW3